MIAVPDWSLVSTPLAAIQKRVQDAGGRLLVLGAGRLLNTYAGRRDWRVDVGLDDEGLQEDREQSGQAKQRPAPRRREVQHFASRPGVDRVSAFTQGVVNYTDGSQPEQFRSGRVSSVRLRRKEVVAQREHNRARTATLLDTFRQLDVDPVVVTSSDRGDILAEFLMWTDIRRTRRVIGA
ncbi:MAG: hypothetical protein HC774_03710 [Sphingomonadales bacterium]|nr:hypothetical protein [Sphingomonadales bacterium]